MSEPAVKLPISRAATLILVIYVIYIKQALYSTGLRNTQDAILSDLAVNNQIQFLIISKFSFLIFIRMSHRAALIEMDYLMFI